MTIRPRGTANFVGSPETQGFEEKSNESPTLLRPLAHRFRQFIAEYIPVGYEDHRGFHYGAEPVLASEQD
jgi:hypothetical protein